MPSISRTDKQNNDLTSTVLKRQKFTFFSVLWDSLTVPGQELFVVHDYDIPPRRFFLVCFSLFLNTTNWDFLMLVRVVKAEQPFCSLLNIKTERFRGLLADCSKMQISLTHCLDLMSH